MTVTGICRGSVVGRLGKMKSQEAVIQLGRHFFVEHFVGEVKRSLPLAGRTFGSAKAFFGDDVAATTLRLDGEHAAGHIQLQILRGHTRQLSGEKVLAIQLVDVDGRERAPQTETLECERPHEAVDFSLKVAEGMSPAKYGHDAISQRNTAQYRAADLAATERLFQVRQTVYRRVPF